MKKNPYFAPVMKKGDPRIPKVRGDSDPYKPRAVAKAKVMSDDAIKKALRKAKSHRPF